MPLPLAAITSFRASINPFSPLSKPCRQFLNLLQTPMTASPSSAAHIQIKIERLARDSPKLPEMTVGFKNGQELRLEIGKNKICINDALEEVSRIGRGIAREESLKA